MPKYDNIIVFKLLHRNHHGQLICWHQLYPKTFEQTRNPRYPAILDHKDYEFPKGFIVYTTLEEAERKRHLYQVGGVEIWKCKTHDKITMFNPAEGKPRFEYFLRNIQHYRCNKIELIQRVS